jgi:hypothetical protein
MVEKDWQPWRVLAFDDVAMKWTSRIDVAVNDW